MFRFTKAKISIGFSLLTLVLVAGCSTAPIRVALPTIADRLVAKDFAQLLVQVDSIAPNATSLRMARQIDSSNTFDTALREELRIAGYRIEPITTELVAETPVVAHDVKRVQVGDGETRTYTVSVGTASFRRRYAISSDGLVEPLAAMEAKGVDTGILSQDDSIFDLESDTIDTPNPTPEPVQAANTNTNTNTGNDSASSQIPEPIEEELIVIPPVVDASSEEPEVNVLLNTQIVGESVLSFSGDSLVLGESNKRRVRNLVSGFDAKTDVFSVLGCVFQDEVSWGDDAAQLAAGRSDRIRSELLYAGIPSEKIRDEACAQDADTGAPIIPVGSVLLLLNRSR